MDVYLSMGRYKTGLWIVNWTWDSIMDWIMNWTRILKHYSLAWLVVIVQLPNPLLRPESRFYPAP